MGYDPRSALLYAETRSDEPRSNSENSEKSRPSPTASGFAGVILWLLPLITENYLPSTICSPGPYPTLSDKASELTSLPSRSYLCVGCQELGIGLQAGGMTTTPTPLLKMDLS